MIAHEDFSAEEYALLSWANARFLALKGRGPDASEEVILELMVKVASAAVADDPRHLNGYLSKGREHVAAVQKQRTIAGDALAIARHQAIAANAQALGLSVEEFESMISKAAAARQPSAPSP